MTLPNLESQNIQLPTSERHRIESPNFQLQNMQSAQTSNMQLPNYFQSLNMQGEQRRYMLPWYKLNVQVGQKQNMVPIDRRYFQSEQRQNIYAAHRPPTRFSDHQRCNIPDNNTQQQNVMQFQHQNEQNLDFSQRSIQEPNIPPIDLSRHAENCTNQLNQLMAAWNPLTSNSSSSPESVSSTSTWSPCSIRTISSPENLPSKQNLHSNLLKSPSGSTQSLPGGSKGN